MKERQSGRVIEGKKLSKMKMEREVLGKGSREVEKLL